MRQLLCRNIKLIARNSNEEGTNGNEVLWNTAKPGDFITQWLCLMSSSLKIHLISRDSLKKHARHADWKQSCCMEGRAGKKIQNTRTPPVAWGSNSPPVSSGSQEWARPSSFGPQTLQAVWQANIISLYISLAPYDSFKLWCGELFPPTTFTRPTFRLLFVLVFSKIWKWCLLILMKKRT